MVSISGSISSASLGTVILEHEVPTPATDGAQLVFTVSQPYVAGDLQVFMDGVRQIVTTDYSETTDTTFTMTFAPDVDETLIVAYLKK